ncbi:outer membrane protein assembly factor BamE [Aidingimonas halophila]|nr:outer membrane protein assembly factor BamE [Aidingimonas halophila]GHC34638.1 hypothetical protein GCM10008094_29520 [Aidingimonas halophila]
MQKLITIITLSAALSLTSGCSYFGVYKRDLPQGNLVDQEMISQLQPGMTRNQVKSIMGTPLLEAPFDASQWDYVFYLDEAYGDVEKRRLTLTFQGDRLANIDAQGDMDSDIELPTDQEAGPAPEGADPQGAMPSNPDEPEPAPGPGTAPSGGETSSEDEPIGGSSGGDDSVESESSSGF